MRPQLLTTAFLLLILAIPDETRAVVILNEYNAVSGNSRLDDGQGIDQRLGLIFGNGGNWFELIVVGDNVDMRGWKLNWTEDEEVAPGGPNAEGTITLSNHDIWSNLRAGSLITFIETSSADFNDIDTSTDISYDPFAGDWWINVSTTEEQEKGENAVATTVTNDGLPGEFSVGSRDWLLTIVDAADNIVFGPVGESLWPAGISGREGGSLEGPLGLGDIPATLEQWRSITPVSEWYDDTGSTSFGLPNVDYDAETMQFSPLQDLTPLRELVTNPFASGDFNGDGMLTVEDLDALTAAVRNEPTALLYDVNQDGRVTAVDRTIWIERIKSTFFGDTNLDGEFSSADFVAVLVAGQFEDMIAGNSTWATGDWDGDGDFTTSDLVRALQAGGYEQGPRGAVAAVPEPSGLLLLSLGLALGLRRRPLSA
jgi:hypothetical protein